MIMSEKKELSKMPVEPNGIIESIENIKTAIDQLETMPTAGNIGNLKGYVKTLANNVSDLAKDVEWIRAQLSGSGGLIAQVAELQD